MLIVTGILFCKSVYRIDTLKVDTQFDGADIKDYGAVYLDQDDQVNFEKVSQLPLVEFLPLKVTGIAFSPKQQVHWVRCLLKNNTAEFQSLILSVENPRINRLQIFTNSALDSLYVSPLVGDIFPSESRIIPHRHFLFPIPLSFRSAWSLLKANEYHP